MRKILNSFASLIAIAFFCIAVRGSLESHHTHTVPRDTPMILDEVIELRQPTYKTPELPEVRLASFEDEFATDPIIKGLTEQDHKELRLIAEAEDLIDGTEGMLWVMLTVINRMRVSGGTVHSTIYAEGQYYTAGMANNPTAASEEALELLLCGVDPSEGARYFRTGHYHSFGEPVAQVGHHFYSR